MNIVTSLCFRRKRGLLQIWVRSSTLQHFVLGNGKCGENWSGKSTSLVNRKCVYPETLLLRVLDKFNLFSRPTKRHVTFVSLLFCNRGTNCTKLAKRGENDWWKEIGTSKSLQTIYRKHQNVVKISKAVVVTGCKWSYCWTNQHQQLHEWLPNLTSAADVICIIIHVHKIICNLYCHCCRLVWRCTSWWFGLSWHVSSLWLLWSWHISTNDKQ